MTFALFCLFAAPAAQAMLLELNFHWVANTTDDLLSYNLQEGSIIQVIAIQKNVSIQGFNTASGQFGDAYGVTSDTTTRADPYKDIPSIDPITGQPYENPEDDPRVPSDKAVYLADTTPDGTAIVYTGSLQNDNGWYGLYTQIYIDDYVYDRVYIRVFGADEIEQGQVTASYWGVSEIHELHPTFQFDTFEKANQNAPNANYFEVIPEPATLGLLGLGGCALAVWRRRRPQEDKR